jgi:hypothetical protein
LFLEIFKNIQKTERLYGYSSSTAAIPSFSIASLYPFFYISPRFMILQQTTKTLLSEINKASGNSLKRSLDLGALLQIAEEQQQIEKLDDLAFSAKFITKSFDVMQRIGKDGNGYEKLSEEFSSQIKKSLEILRQILEKTDAMTRSHFSGTYLEMNTLTMQNLMQLYHDLSWYKNFQIDKVR